MYQVGKIMAIAGCIFFVLGILYAIIKIWAVCAAGTALIEMLGK
jgi:hypothetical protein